MTKSVTQKMADAFCEDVFIEAFSAAERHQIGDALATVLLIEQLVSDCALSSLPLTRAWLAALLDELGSRPDSHAEEQAAMRRNSAADELVRALQATLSVDLETTVLPGGKMGERLN